MKTAIYPGSFDPITKGHTDILDRALRLFDSIVVAVIHNPMKHPIFTQEERMKHIGYLYQDEPRVKVEGFEGLLVDFAKEKNISTIIRGIRALSDFDYELQMSLTNRKLAEHFETVFLMTDEKYSFLSSSVVRQVSMYKGDVSAFVSPYIEEALRKKFQYE